MLLTVDVIVIQEEEIGICGADVDTTVVCGSSCYSSSVADVMDPASLEMAADAAMTAACGSSCYSSSVADAVITDYSVMTVDANPQF